MTNAQTLQNYILKLRELNISLIKLNPTRKIVPDFEEQDKKYRALLQSITNLKTLTSHMITTIDLIQVSIIKNQQEGYTEQTITTLNTWYTANLKLFDAVEAVLQQSPPHFGVAM